MGLVSGTTWIVNYVTSISYVTSENSIPAAAADNLTNGCIGQMANVVLELYSKMNIRCMKLHVL